MIVLDFETFSEAAIGKTGAYLYASHPSTELLCLAYKADDEPTQLLTPGDLLSTGIPERLQRAIDDGEEFSAHNAFFERVVWYFQLHKKLGWPDIPPELWTCSAAQAAAMSLPRDLAGAGAAIGLDMEKDKSGYRIMLKLSQPRKPSKLNPATRWTPEAVPADFEKLYAYCIRDVDSQHELRHAIPTLSDAEQLLWQLDQTINLRGFCVDKPAAVGALQIIDELQARGDARCREITGGDLQSVRQVKKLLPWLQQNSPVAWVTDCTKATVESLLDHPEINGSGSAIEEVLRIRQELSKASTAKYEAMDLGSDANGVVRDTLLFHGASTGRWAGRRLQPHNLPRLSIIAKQLASESDAAFCLRADIEATRLCDTIATGDPDLLELLYGDPYAALSAALRNCIVPSPGYELLVSDFSAIEARVLAWLAGEAWKLQAFRDYDNGTGRDIYLIAAENIYRQTGLVADRQIGKVSELALGYGGGIGAFQTMAVGYGVEVGDDVADIIKHAWRKAHRNVTSWWYALGDAAIEAVSTPGEHPAGPVAFFREDRFLRCRLPNGRLISYCDPEIRQVAGPRGMKPELTYMSVDAITRKWRRQKTYGGKLAENVTQAVARDFLVDAMFAAEANGYQVRAHVHDELICESETGDIEGLDRIMSVVPAWGEGCPIAAEGFAAKRYRK